MDHPEFFTPEHATWGSLRILWAIGRCGEVEDWDTSTKLVLVNLYGRLGQNSTVWPSVGRIALECKLAENTVRKAIRTFEERGFIATEARSGKDGSKLSNRYHFRMQVLLHWADSILSKTAPQPLHPPGSTVDPTPFNHCTPPVQPFTPKRDMEERHEKKYEEEDPQPPQATTQWTDEDLFSMAHEAILIYAGGPRRNWIDDLRRLLKRYPPTSEEALLALAETALATWKQEHPSDTWPRFPDYLFRLIQPAPKPTSKKPKVDADESFAPPPPKPTGRYQRDSNGNLVLIPY